MKGVESNKKIYQIENLIVEVKRSNGSIVTCRNQFGRTPLGGQEAQVCNQVKIQHLVAQIQRELQLVSQIIYILFQTQFLTFFFLLFRSVIGNEETLESFELHICVKDYCFARDDRLVGVAVMQLKDIIEQVRCSLNSLAKPTRNSIETQIQFPESLKPASCVL